MSDRTFYAIVGVLLVVLVGVVAVGLLSRSGDDGVNQSRDDFYAELLKIDHIQTRDVYADLYENDDMAPLSITNVRYVDTIGTTAQCFTFRGEVDGGVIEAETLIYMQNDSWNSTQRAEITSQHCN